MNNLISVIIPIYNAEKYLEKCIESILIQMHKDFELILVDDGSKDNSGRICDEYAEKDSRIRVIHKKNAGVSAARNTGIENAKGEFIAFVDSDDWLQKNSLEILYKEIKAQNADLVAGAFERIVRQGRQRHPFKSALYCGDEIAENITDLISLLAGTVWAKLFKRDIIVNKNLRFDPEIPSCEDSVFLMTYLQFCEKIALKDEIVYTYNCMVLSSAVHKFYEKYGYYCACLCNATTGIVERSNLDTRKKHILTYGLANRFCCFAVDHYLANSWINNDLKQKLKEVVGYFEVSTDKECFSASGTKLFLYDEFVLLAEKDIDGFLKLYRRNLMKNNFVSYIKHRVRPTLKKLGLI